MVMSEVKAWFLANLVMILGVVLALTAGYAAWLHFVTVPRLELKLTAAEANSKIWEANTKTCTVANSGLAEAIERQNAAIEAMRKAGIRTQGEVKAALLGLQNATAGVEGKLAAFTPDPNKTDCQNAMAELQAFRKERGR